MRVDCILHLYKQIIKHFKQALGRPPKTNGKKLSVVYTSALVRSVLHWHIQCTQGHTYLQEPSLRTQMHVYFWLSLLSAIFWQREEAARNTSVFAD